MEEKYNEPEFTEEQLRRIDEIHNATLEYCKVLTENEDLEYDMSFIGDIADYAAETLVSFDHSVRYPAIVYFEDGPQIMDYVETGTI